MQPCTDPGAAASPRGGSGSDAYISWHSSNTAKTYRALSLFANLKANLHTAPTAAHPPRRGSAPHTYAHTPPATSRLAINSPSLNNSPAQKQRRGSSAGINTPSKGAAADTSIVLTYTEAEISSMSPAQLRRQLRVASAVTQRLYRRTHQLQKQVEEWENRWAKQQQLSQPQSTNSCASNGSFVNANGVPTVGAVQDLITAEKRAEQLQKEVKQLGLEKEALTNQLQQQHQMSTEGSGGQGVTSNPSCSTEKSTQHKDQSNREPQQKDSAAAPTRDSRHNNNLDVKLLRETVRQLQHRLNVSEERVQRATQVQLDALLQHRHASTVSAQHPPTVALVSAEVQKLFQLMQEQLVSNATQQQAERARMNELFYELERQRGLM